MKNVQKKAKEFVKEQKLKGEITPSVLIKAAQNLGFDILYYSIPKSTENVQTVLDAIGMAEYAKTVSAFTYVDSNKKIVFVKHNQTQKEQTILLAHELGHICLKHPQQNGALDGDATKENEANEFAKYILSREESRTNILWIGGMSAAVALAVCLGSWGHLHNRQDVPQQSNPGMVQITQPQAAPTPAMQPTTPEPKIQQTATPTPQQTSGSITVYRTQTGDKYHKQDCQYVAYNKNTSSLSVEEAREQGLTPCKVCKPEE